MSNDDAYIPPSKRNNITEKEWHCVCGGVYSSPFCSFCPGPCDDGGSGWVEIDVVSRHAVGGDNE